MQEIELKPIAILMIEHRLIERMITCVKIALTRFKKDSQVDHQIIRQFIEFIREYADACHHGKEEDILFRELKKKDLSPDLEQILNELIEEHKLAREITKKLDSANQRYADNQETLFPDIITYSEQLIDFYPKHIIKEDKHFFKPVMAYFSDQEKQALIQEENEFDRMMIHNKYKRIVENLEADTLS